MEKRLLITRTRHDKGNEYLYAYSEEIIEQAEILGWKADKVEDHKNKKSEIESRIEKTNPDFVFFNGHGSESAIYGHDNEEIINVESSGLLDNKIVFARSCKALIGLGKGAVKKGCRAFVGYSGDFIIPHVNEYEATPLRDPVAKPVLEVSNLVGKLILKGDSVEAAVAAAQRKASDIMLKMLVSDEPYDSATFRILYMNSSNLSYEGDGSSKV